MRNMLERALRLLALALVPGALVAGCSGGGGGDGSVQQQAINRTGIHGGSFVPLRDSAGAFITAASTAPYSPDETCGRCHDTATISAGYHFQQGRRAMMLSQLDSFSTKKWLLSDGMYGKW